MFGVDCDNCGESWYNDHYGYSYMSDVETAREWAGNDDWLRTDDDKDYCPACHSTDDDDNLVINAERTKK